MVYDEHNRQPPSSLFTRRILPPKISPQRRTRLNSMEHSTMAKTGFNQLPLETVLQIVTYLENDIDRLCLALTCRSLLNLLDRDKTLQRSPRYTRTCHSRKLASVHPSDGGFFANSRIQDGGVVSDVSSFIQPKNFLSRTSEPTVTNERALLGHW